jgi:hypothetical protein
MMREHYTLREPKVNFNRRLVCPRKTAGEALLTNAVYTGYVTYAGSDEHGNRTKIPDRGRRKPVEWFEGKHEALVGLELFRKVQTIRQNRYHRSTTLANPARSYPLTGVLYCAAQHSPLRGTLRAATAATAVTT